MEPSARVYVFGSSGSGFGTRTSDMDMCLIVNEAEFLAGHPRLRSQLERDQPKAQAQSGMCVS